MFSMLASLTSCHIGGISLASRTDLNGHIRVPG